MKNPWVVYSLARLGVFAVILSILLFINFDWLYSVLVAAALSLAFSLVFLNRQRERLSKSIYEQVKKNKDEGIEDADSDFENDLLDR
jgi:O-antigen ligase